MDVAHASAAFLWPNIRQHGHGAINQENTFGWELGGCSSVCQPATRAQTLLANPLGWFDRNVGQSGSWCGGAIRTLY